jgi:hypothetical protein
MGFVSQGESQRSLSLELFLFFEIVEVIYLGFYNSIILAELY